MGRHSLLSVRVVSRIRKDMGVNISLVELLKTPSLRDFSALVEFLVVAKRASMEQNYLSYENLAGGVV